MTVQKKSSTTPRSAGMGLVLLSGLMLAGCTMDGAEIEDSYVAASVEERYPISVTEAPVKINVSARSGALRAEQLNRVVNFAQDARGNATSRVTVGYSSGSSNARKVAEETIAVLVAQGIPRSMIATGRLPTVFDPELPSRPVLPDTRTTIYVHIDSGILAP